MKVAGKGKEFTEEEIALKNKCYEVLGLKGEVEVKDGKERFEKELKMFDFCEEDVVVPETNGFEDLFMNIKRSLGTIKSLFEDKTV